MFVDNHVQMFTTGPPCNSIKRCLDSLGLVLMVLKGFLLAINLNDRYFHWNINDELTAQSLCFHGLRGS